MALRPLVKPPVKPASKKVELKPSKLKVFDIPLDQIIESPDNPNEMDEVTLDQLVEGMKAEGCDEPIHVIPVEVGPNAGKWIITSGHHRAKAAAILKLKVIPAIIKQGWDDDRRQIELVRRNMLKGKIDAGKFTKLYQSLASKGYDESMLKLQMGFTKGEQFKALYQGIAKKLTPSQRKQLDAAKENIKSVDDLSSVLNDIFTNHGNELECNMLVFNYGKGTKRKVYYVKADPTLGKMLEKMQVEIVEKSLDATDVFKSLVSGANLANISKSAPARTLRKIVKPS